MTFGATEALASALLALLEPGDEVAFLDPTYDSYPAVVALAGASARPIVLRAAATGGCEPAAVEAAIGPRTRVLLLNSPHNPTGRVLDGGELELLAATCREHDVIALTDEVYEHLVFDGTPRPDRDAARHGGAHADGVLDRQDLLGDRLEDRLGERAGRADRAPARRQAVPHVRRRDAVPARRRGGARAARRGRRRAGGVAARASATASPTACAAPASTCCASQATYFLNADGTPLGELDATALCERLAASRRASSRFRPPRSPPIRTARRGRSCASRSRSATR